ncbi:MAG TPA: DUF5683 domain-containing protein [Puia sp.]|jgi:hypothetical protein
MKMVRYLWVLSVFLFCHHLCWCQQKNDTIPAAIKGKTVIGTRTDTIPHKKDSAVAHTKGKKDSPYKVDSLAKKKHDPRKATLYSTFCPGLGQIYNRKYWKLPLVYAAVGIPAYEYFNNKAWYQRCQYALAVIVGAQATGVVNQDSLAKVNPLLQTFVKAKDDNSVRTYRNEYRKDQDYSVLFVLLFWGLQIVDATVDAHLMNFDISPDLSMHLQQGSGSPQAGRPSGAAVAGVGLVLDWHKPRYKSISLP